MNTFLVILKIKSVLAGGKSAAPFVQSGEALWRDDVVKHVLVYCHRDW